MPSWSLEWLGIIEPALQIILILLAAWLLRSLVRRLVQRMAVRYSLPAEVAMGLRRGSSLLIYAVTVLAILERLGVSGAVLWTALTGFALAAAVAFFAAWSVLSNIFCSVLIVTTRLFRLYDHIEVLEGGDKPGLAGRVIDINVIYTTLEEVKDGESPTVLHIPNSLFFQRITRRWR